ncbi:sigma factor [Bradyrhizobium sp. ORS 86]|uniref:sigma factor n=1 Tax=Bradyrhizobium sp. ORS 86 TaxID=1685970 RepID=UPI00388DE720
MPPRLRASILAITRRRAPDLVSDLEDVLDEAFVLMMEAPRRFDQARGSASTFITSVCIPEAIQRVRAKMARPGTTTRRRKRPKTVAQITFPMPDPKPEADTVPVAGYGSEASIEAACDARALYWRASAPLRLLICGLMDGKTQIEIADELATDRFKVARMIKSLHGAPRAA